MPVSIKQYEILLDDHEKDPDYTKGKILNGYTVYGSAQEIGELLSQKFLVTIDGNHRHHNDCTIYFGAKKDRQIPNNPKCFGTITIVGNESKVTEIENLLSESIKDLTNLSRVLIQTDD